MLQRMHTGRQQLMIIHLAVNIHAAEPLLLGLRLGDFALRRGHVFDIIIVNTGHLDLKIVQRLIRLSGTSLIRLAGPVQTPSPNRGGVKRQLPKGYDDYDLNNNDLGPNYPGS